MYVPTCIGLMAGKVSRVTIFARLTKQFDQTVVQELTSRTTGIIDKCFVMKFYYGGCSFGSFTTLIVHLSTGYSEHGARPTSVVVLILNSSCEIGDVFPVNKGINYFLRDYCLFELM